MFEGSSEESSSEESGGEESSAIRIERIPRSEESEILTKPSTVFPGSSKSRSSSRSGSSKSTSSEEAASSESEDAGPPVVDVGELQEELRKIKRKFKLDFFDPLYRTIMHVKDKKGRPLPPIAVGD